MKTASNKNIHLMYKQSYFSQKNKFHLKFTKEQCIQAQL